MTRPAVLLALLLFLAACSPPPEPTPFPEPQPTAPAATATAAPLPFPYPDPAGTPTPTPLPFPDGYRPPSTNISFLPLVTTRPCNSSAKRAVALAYWERGWPHDLLCMPAETTLYHTWGVVAGGTELGQKVSMVWADEKNGYEYLERFRDYIESEEARTGKPAEIVVLFANEPDRPDQADMTTEEVALFFLDLVEICPGCRFVGPMYSAADAGQMVREVWDIVLEICGEPCPAMDSLYAHSLHVYPRPDLNYGPTGRTDDFCRIVDGGDCLRPVWVTELGYRSCFPGVRKIFADWIRQAEQDPRIEYYFVYSTYQEPREDCYFTPLLKWGTWATGPVLDSMGLAWRDAATE